MGRPGVETQTALSRASDPAHWLTAKRSPLRVRDELRAVAIPRVDRYAVIRATGRRPAPSATYVAVLVSINQKQAQAFRFANQWRGQIAAGFNLQIVANTITKAPKGRRKIKWPIAVAPPGLYLFW
jgi:hypothetical protein